MIDRSRIGFTTAPTAVTVDAWRVKLFCQAIGDAEPAAGAPLPPTFLKAIEGEHFSSAALLQLLQVPMQGVLHAEQRFDHVASVRVGDLVEVSRRIERIDDKKDGALSFIVVETEYRVASRRVATSTQTILVRNTMAAAA